MATAAGKRPVQRGDRKEIFEALAYVGVWHGGDFGRGTEQTELRGR